MQHAANSSVMVARLTDEGQMTGLEMLQRIGDFDGYLQDHGRAAKTRLTYKQRTRGFCEWVGDQEITPRHLFGYKEYLQSDKEKPWTGGEKGCRPRTVRSAFCALRSFWKFLLLDGVRGLPDIAIVPSPPLDTAQRDVPSVEQVRALFAAADKMGAHYRSKEFAAFLRLRALAVLSLAFGCALRRSEMLALDLQDVRLDTTPPRVTVRSGKGGKSRWVALGEREAEYLRQWIEVRGARQQRLGRELEALLVDDKSRRMGALGCETLIKTLKNLAGLSECGFTLHGLRHRAGSIIVKEMGYKAAQTVLGHASMVTTVSVYTHVDADDIRDAAASVSNAIHTPTAQPSNASAAPTGEVRRGWRQRGANPRQRTQRV